MILIVTLLSLGGLIYPFMYLIVPVIYLYLFTVFIGFKNI